MGNFKYGDKNDRKERLLEFALEHDMIICNMKFQQKNCRKWTWRSNDGKTRNMIDMILIRRKWATSVQQCRTFQNADINSDHSLVMANIKIKPKKKHKAQFRKRRDIARLSNEEISNAYRVALEQRHLGQPESSQNLDGNAKRIAMAMEKAAEETILETEMITKKWITLETLSLVQEKRILKKKTVANWQTGNIDRNAMRYEKRPEQTKRNGRKDSART